MIEDETISSGSSGYGLKEYLAEEEAYTKFIEGLLKSKENVKETREEFFKRFDEAWDDKTKWGGEYGEGI